MKTNFGRAAFAALIACSCMGAWANGPQSLKVTFNGTDNANWQITQHGNDGVVDGGLFTCVMKDQGSSYRADIQFNQENNEKVNFTLNPSVDKFLAIKFIGQRPSGNLKMEFNTGNTWFNTKWNGGNPSSVSTDAGNYIYYFDLTLDQGYTGNSINVHKLNIVIADNKNASDIVYQVDWIATFASVAELQAYANWADDGLTDTHDGNIVVDGTIPTAFKTLNAAVDAVPQMQSADETTINNIYVNGDADITSRVDINSKRILVKNNTDGEVVLKSTMTNSLALLTKRNSSNYNSYFEADGITFDGGGVANSSAFFEAANYCTSHIKNCKFQNVTSANGTGAVVSNKTGGHVILENVEFQDCVATDASTPAIVFAGTDNVHMRKNIEYHNVTGYELFLETHFVRVQDCSWTTPINVFYKNPAEGNVFMSCPGGQNTRFYGYFNIINPGWRYAAQGYTDTKLYTAPPFQLTAEVPYATFCVNYDALIPEGVKAYKATSTDGSTITFQRITGNIPANKGVVLYGNEGTYTLQTAKQADALTGNILVGTTEDITAPANCYVMSKSKSQAAEALVFTKYTGATIPANKAYLTWPSGASSIRFNFDADMDEFGGDGYSTEISAVETQAAAGACYDLFGRRVMNKANGLFIQNGKKVIVK